MLLAVPALAFLHDTALQFSPFGGLGLPRYLIYTFPFVLAPLGLVYRRLPLTTLALAGVSAVQMTLMTATIRSPRMTSTGPGERRERSSPRTRRASSG